ncbi:hypothetical protein ACFLTH_04695 [Bacteroidota bacterium]
MKKGLLFFILFKTLLFAQEQMPPDNSFGGEIITKEEIRLSAAARLSDIFSLINSSNGNTITGYSWMVNLNSLTPNWEQNWVLMIDGQRIDLDFPYVKNINLLPVGVNEIEYVEIINIPGIVEGEFIDKGLIHMHTSKIPEGFSLHSSLSSANETGEPGPGKYSNPQASNIDQIGPYYWTSFNFGSRSLNLRLGLKHHLHIYSDPKINNRLKDYPWEFKEIRMTGVSLKIDTEIFGSNHSLFVGGTSTGDPVLFPSHGSGLLFFNPFGSEIPVKLKFVHGGLRGDFNLNSKINLDYAFKYSSSIMDLPSTQIQKNFDWEMNNYDGLIKITSNESDSQTQISAGFNHVKMATDYELEKDDFMLFRINGQIDGLKSEKFVQLIYGGLVLGGTNTAFNIGTRFKYLANKNSKINANISYSSRLPEEDNSIWYWVRNGYEFLDDHSMNYSIDGKLKMSRELTVDFSYQLNFEESLKLTMGGFFRNFTDVYTERQQYLYLPDSDSIAAATQVYTSETGTIAGLSVNALHTVSSEIKQELYYRYILHFEGSEMLLAGMRSFPQHKFMYSFVYTPAPSLSLMTKFTYISDTYWSDFEGINRDSNELYNHVLDGNVLLDIAIQKSFWYDKIFLNLYLKNMLGNVIIYYPVGAMFDMTLFMQVELRLDSIF